MEASLNHPVFDFTSIMNPIRGGAFEENALWYTSTVKVEEKGLPYYIYKRKNFSGIISKILKSSERVRC